MYSGFRVERSTHCIMDMMVNVLVVLLAYPLSGLADHRFFAAYYIHLCREHHPTFRLFVFDVVVVAAVAAAAEAAWVVAGSWALLLLVVYVGLSHREVG